MTSEELVHVISLLYFRSHSVELCLFLTHLFRLIKLIQNTFYEIWMEETSQYSFLHRKVTMKIRDFFLSNMLSNKTEHFMDWHIHSPNPPKTVSHYFSAQQLCTKSMYFILKAQGKKAYFI